MPSAADAPRCLLSVHAHPDDEASKGAGTVHKYHEQGVRTVLVCCTGGEAGDILNPVLDTEEVRERLHDVRMEELALATSIIGYDEVVMLGYRDSGCPTASTTPIPAASPGPRSTRRSGGWWRSSDASDRRSS